MMKREKKQHKWLFVFIAALFCFASCSDETATKSDDSIDTLIYMDLRMQQANKFQVYRGDEMVYRIKDEVAGTNRMAGYERKNEKLQYVLKKMDEIDAHTAAIIHYMDDLKKGLLKSAGENTNSILSPGKEVMPAGVDMNQLKNPGFEIEQKDVVGLRHKIDVFRDQLIDNCANYTLGSRTFHLDRIGNIAHSSEKDFVAVLDKKLSVDTYNYPEDKMVLTDLYTVLHNAAQFVASQHNSTLITNLGLLTTLEQEILSARAMALANWQSKVSTGEYGFDSISAVVDGPNVVASGEETSYRVFIGALNSYQQPEIEVTHPSDARIVYNDDGTYSIFVSPEKKGTIEVSGTITIKNKSGIGRTMDWKRSVEVR